MSSNHGLFSLLISCLPLLLLLLLGEGHSSGNAHFRSPLHNRRRRRRRRRLFPSSSRDDKPMMGFGSLRWRRHPLTAQLAVASMMHYATSSRDYYFIRFTLEATATPRHATPRRSSYGARSISNKAVAPGEFPTGNIHSPLSPFFFLVQQREVNTPICCEECCVLSKGFSYCFVFLKGLVSVLCGFLDAAGND